VQLGEGEGRDVDPPLVFAHLRLAHHLRTKRSARHDSRGARTKRHTPGAVHAQRHDSGSALYCHSPP